MVRLGMTKRSPSTKSSNQRCSGTMRCRAGSKSVMAGFLRAVCERTYRYCGDDGATIGSIRHARACPGHDSLYNSAAQKDVDGRTPSVTTRGACHRAARCADPLALLSGLDENNRKRPGMSLFAKLSTYDERS